METSACKEGSNESHVMFVKSIHLSDVSGRRQRDVTRRRRRAVRPPLALPICSAVICPRPYPTDSLRLPVIFMSFPIKLKSPTFPIILTKKFRNWHFKKCSGFESFYAFCFCILGVLFGHFLRGAVALISKSNLWKCSSRDSKSYILNCFILLTL